MKNNEIASIILIAAVSGLIAWFGGRLIIKPDVTKQTPIEVIQPISSEFTLPDQTVFNENAINPTERIKIGETNTDQIFE